ncbi:MAG: 2-C-methyl-D-erythritol 4-phosphate cytidylyltransferase [Verrucomicrobiota bacterium]
MLTAIIVAAGNSRRMGFDKLFARIAGKVVIAHTIDAFERTDSVAEIILVARKERRSEFEELAGQMTKVRRVILGGEHRQDSVRAGLEGLAPAVKYIAVHDGARPLITPAQIDRVFEQARVHGAAALAEPVSDTLKRADSDLSVMESLDRNRVYAMQTPQIFERNLLEEAYRRVGEEGKFVTDEVSAIEHSGGKIVLVTSEDFNFKITYDRDLRLAESVLQERQRAA